jgi:hypothetical protein
MNIRCRVRTPKALANVTEVWNEQLASMYFLKSTR